MACASLVGWVIPRGQDLAALPRQAPSPEEASMSWKPFVVGVDASPEAAGAAVFAVDAAQRAATACHLIHVTRDPWGAGPTPGGDDQACAQVVAALEDRVPAAVLRT